MAEKPKDNNDSPADETAQRAAGDDGMGNTPETPQPDSAAQQPAPSDEEVWRDLVARLQDDGTSPTFGNSRAESDLKAPIDTVDRMRAGITPAEPSDARTADGIDEPNQTKPGQTKSNQTNPSETKPRETNPGNAESSGTLFSTFDPFGIAGGPDGMDTDTPRRSTSSHHSADFNASGQDTSRQGNSGHGTSGPRDYSLPEDVADEEFVPPEPEPLSSLQPSLVLGWLGAAGAPIALLLCTLLWRGVPGMIIIGLVLAFLAGFGYLVYRLPKNREHNDDGGIRF